MDTIEAVSTGIARISDLFNSVIGLIGKSKLDVTEKERMINQVEILRITTRLELQKKLLDTSWIKYIIFGSGILIGMMLINNNVIMPYVPYAKPMEIPDLLWGVFMGLLGIDVTTQFVKNRCKNKEG